MHDLLLYDFNLCYNLLKKPLLEFAIAYKIFVRQFHCKKNNSKIQILRVCLVSEFKLTFSHFKQYYTFFHKFFHSYIFQKTTNNNSQTTLPNTPWNFEFFFCSILQIFCKPLHVQAMASSSNCNTNWSREQIMQWCSFLNFL